MSENARMARKAIIREIHKNVRPIPANVRPIKGR